MGKLNQSNGAFDDGIYYYFGPNTPEHIRLEMKTDSPNVESCDVRLTTINDTTNLVYRKIPWTDVAFFRFGYYNYQKMNLVSMVNMFVGNTWYPVDLLIDWNAQTVTVYVNDTATPLASDIFFTKSGTNVPSANTIVLYNLTPGTTCSIRNL